MHVWSWNEETDSAALKTVLETYVNETMELTHLQVAGSEIICTPTHPFYSPVKGWTAACRLRAGDILQTVHGEYVIVEWIQHELLESPTLVYNFQVAEDHNYYVSEIELLVHNSCGPKDYSPKGSGRNGAFKQAKRDLGIPVTEQPEKILPNYNKRDVLLPGRVYLFKNGMKIRDDIYGHAFADGGKLSSHFNTIIGHYFY